MKLPTSARPPLPSGPHLVAGAGEAGAAAARALAARLGPGAVTVWDAVDDERTRAAAAPLRDLGVDVRLGAEGADLLTGAGGARCLVKSPGIPPGAPLVAAARAAGLAVLDELELGWRLDARPLVAVTGTNGKSTVTALVAAALSQAGERPVRAGNLERGPALSRAADMPGTVVVAEASSFQLEGCPEMVADAAALTNLTAEHLERHASMADYAAAKARLFVRDGRTVPLAAVGTADRHGMALADELERRGARVARVHGDDAGYRIDTARPRWPGTEVAARTPDGPVAFTTRLIGAHQAENALTALALADLLGVPRAATLAALAATAPVPGRFARVDDGSPGPAVVLDYAHNAAGWERTLQTARSLGDRVLVVVSTHARHTAEQHAAIGCAVAAGADAVTVTSQPGLAGVVPEPHPALVAAARAARRCAVEADRALAIERAIAAARDGDVLVVKGDGAGERPGGAEALVRDALGGRAGTAARG